jgi:serine phosphatase RsbU (regulator of sigma subunit)/anti-sigma regulatory factor (Ser/Thr protein kinase)/PAS domain-containing protein
MAEMGGPAVRVLASGDAPADGAAYAVAAPDAVAELRRRFSHLPLIAVAGRGGEDAVLAALAVGADEVVPTARLDEATIAAAAARAQARRTAVEHGTEDAQLRTIIMSNADGIIVVDASGALLFLNPVAERMFGRSAEELVGQTVGFPLVAGEVQEVELVSPGGPVVAELRVVRIEWQGAPADLASIRDITDRRRAEEQRERAVREHAAREESEATAERMRSLLQLTEVALEHLELNELLEEVVGNVRAIVQADTAALLLVESDDRFLVGRCAQGLERGRSEGVRLPIGAGFAGRVAAARHALVIEDTREESPLEAPLEALGVRSLIGAPLMVKGRTLGVLRVGAHQVQRFGEREASLLHLLADRAALAIDHARLYEHEHHIAATLQQSLLPSRLPHTPELQVAARYLPAGEGADVGGDWYDVIPFPSGRLMLVVGDVASRGLEAATLMGQLRNAARAFVVDGRSPRQLAEGLDILVRTLEPGGMATLASLEYDPEQASARLALAGHPPPLVWRPGDAPRFLPRASSPPIGAVATAFFDEQVHELPRGSSVLLYTDGLVERRGVNLDVGFERLRRAVACGPAEPEAMCDHILRVMLGDERSPDDVALIVMRLVPLPYARLEMELPAEPTLIASVRRVLARWLRQAGAEDDEIGELLVATSEACANAIEHANAPRSAAFEVTAELDGADVVMAIRDHGAWRGPRGKHRGRGMILMEGLTDSMEIERTPTGTVVRLRRRLAHPHPAPRG